MDSAKVILDEIRTGFVQKTYNAFLDPYNCIIADIMEGYCTGAVWHLGIGLGLEWPVVMKDYTIYFRDFVMSL